MPSKNSTTTQQSGPSPAVSQAYANLVGAGANTVNNPLQLYGGPMVAGFSPQQTAGFSTIDASQGIGTPYLNAASQEFGAATNPLWQTLPQFNSQNVNQYMSPYTKDVTGALTNLYNQQNAQQLQQVQGNAATAGAYGGDREAVAQALTSQQQQLAEAPTLAQVQQQGYQTGLGEFNTQQQQQLAAEQGNAWLASQAGFGMAGLGSEAQNMALTGANAEIGAGGMQQGLAQEMLNIPYQQFMQTQAYPYQELGFLAPLIEGTGSLSGGTSSTTYPGPSTISQIGGLGIAGLGAYGLANQSGLFNSGGDYSGYPSSGDYVGAKRGGRFQAGGMLPSVPGIGMGVPNIDLSYIPQGSPGATPNPSLSPMQPVTSTTQSGGGGGILGDVGPLVGLANFAMNVLAHGGRVHRADGGETQQIPGQPIASHATATSGMLPAVSLINIDDFIHPGPMVKGAGPPRPPSGQQPQQSGFGLGQANDLVSSMTKVNGMLGGSSSGQSRGGMVGHYQDGGAGIGMGGGQGQVPVQVAAQFGGAPPGIQQAYQQLLELPLNRLEEMAVQFPASTQQGQLVQRALQMKRATPGSGTASVAPPGGTPAPGLTTPTSGQPQQQQQGQGYGGGTAHPMAEGGGIASDDRRGFVTTDEIDPEPIVDHSGDHVVVRYPSEKKTLKLRLPSMKHEHHAAGGSTGSFPEISWDQSGGWSIPPSTLGTGDNPGGTASSSPGGTGIAQFGPMTPGGYNFGVNTMTAPNGVALPFLSQPGKGSLISSSMLGGGNPNVGGYGGIGNWFNPIPMSVSYGAAGATPSGPGGSMVFPSTNAYVPGMGGVISGLTGGAGTIPAWAGGSPATAAPASSSATSPLATLGIDPSMLTDSSQGGKRGGRIGLADGGDTAGDTTTLAGMPADGDFIEPPGPPSTESASPSMAAPPPDLASPPGMLNPTPPPAPDLEPQLGGAGTGPALALPPALTIAPNDKGAGSGAPPAAPMSEPPPAPQKPAAEKPQASDTTAQPAANPSSWLSIGDSIGTGYSRFAGVGGKWASDPGDTDADSAAGRSPQQVLDRINGAIKADPGYFHGKSVILSSGVSNDPSQISLVPQQIAALKEAGASNIQLVGVGNRAGVEAGKHYDLRPYNPQLEGFAKDAGVNFGGPLPAVVHPATSYYGASVKMLPGAPPPPAAGGMESDLARPNAPTQSLEINPPSPTTTDDGALVRHYESAGMARQLGISPYVIGVGGTDLSKAPQDQYGFPTWEGHNGSHAAGAYQFEPGTWAKYAAPLGIHDFSPASQDAVFRAAHLAEGWAPWAPYNKQLAAAIGRGETSGGPEDTVIGQDRGHLPVENAAYIQSPSAPSAAAIPDYSAMVNEVLQDLSDRSKSGGNMYASPWLPVIAAGLGMMASRSPFPGVAAGEGGLAGLKMLEDQQRTLPENELKNIQAATAKLGLEMLPQRMQLAASLAGGETGTGTAAAMGRGAPPAGTQGAVAAPIPPASSAMEQRKNVVSPVSGLPLPPDYGQAAAGTSDAAYDQQYSVIDGQIANIRRMAALYPDKLPELMGTIGRLEVSRAQLMNQDIRMAGERAGAEAQARVAPGIAEEAGKQAVMYHELRGPGAALLGPGGQIVAQSPQPVETIDPTTGRQYRTWAYPALAGAAPTGGGAASAGQPTTAGAPNSVGPAAPGQAFPTQLGPGEREALVTRAKEEQGQRQKTIDSASAAQAAQATLTKMGIDADKIYTGPLAPEVQGLNRYLRLVNPDLNEPVASYEDFVKNAGQLTRQTVRQLSSRAAVQEYNLVTDTLPNPTLSPQGLKRVIGEFMGLNDYAIVKAQAQQDWEQAHGGLGHVEGFETAFQRQISPTLFVVRRMPSQEYNTVKEQLMKTQEGRDELQALAEQAKWLKRSGLSDAVR